MKRLSLRLSLALAAALCAAAAGAQPRVSAVDAVGFTVSEMDRSVAFFRDVLGFEKLTDVEVSGGDYERLQGVFGMRARFVRMRLGDEQIELTEYLAPRGRPIPPGLRSHDRSFQHIAIVVSDMAKAYARLRERKVEHASTGPQKLPEYIKAAAGIEAFYFKDPDGHHLEVLAFPQGKGANKWHRATDKLFLGIDHTAIGVSDSDASFALYRDLLGLTVAGDSENYGPEQEHLNNVFGARLRITGLKAASGPGIEFLEYLAPRDGRPGPEDLRPNDLLHWQTTLVTANAEELARSLFKVHALLLSPGAVTVGGELGFRKGMLLRDRDGHGLRIVER